MKSSKIASELSLSPLILATIVHTQLTTSAVFVVLPNCWLVTAVFSLTFSLNLFRWCGVFSHQHIFLIKLKNWILKNFQNQNAIIFYVLLYELLIDFKKYQLQFLQSGCSKISLKFDWINFCLLILPIINYPNDSYWGLIQNRRFR